MKEIHCIPITSYVVGQHSTVASSTGRPCRGSSFPAGEWQCFLREEQRECIESICMHNILVSLYLMLFQLIVRPPPHCLRCVDLQSVTRVNLSEPHITNLTTQYLELVLWLPYTLIIQTLAGGQWTHVCIHGLYTVYIIVLEFPPYDCGVRAPLNGQGTHLWSFLPIMKPGLCDSHSV